MSSLNNFVVAVERFKKFNPTHPTNKITNRIAANIAYQKENLRDNYYRSYNVALLDAIALTDDYSLESIQSLVNALPASDSDSSMDRIRAIFSSGQERDAVYLLRDIKKIVDGTSGNHQSVLDASFELLIDWLEAYHGKLNDKWNPNKPIQSLRD